MAAGWLWYIDIDRRWHVMREDDSRISGRRRGEARIGSREHARTGSWCQCGSSPEECVGQLNEWRVQRIAEYRSLIAKLESEMTRPPSADEQQKLVRAAVRRAAARKQREAAR